MPWRSVAVALRRVTGGTAGEEDSAEPLESTVGEDKEMEGRRTE